MDNYDEIVKLRKFIDEVDKKMAQLFNERMELVQKIGMLKKEINLPIENKNREQEIIDKNREFILNGDYLRYYYEFISKLLELSKDLQSK